MITNWLNIIQNQSIEIEFENLDNAIGVQDRIGEIFYEKLQPGMERLFNEMVGEKYFISKSNMEINSGILSLNNWEQEWVENTLRKLKEELITLNRKEYKQQDDLKEFAEESFLFFLEKGFLPWNNRIDSIHQIEEEISLDSDFIIKLRQLCSSSVKACKRLSYQFSQGFRKKIIDIISEDRKEKLQTIILLMQNLKEFQIDKQIIDAGLIKFFSSDKTETLVVQFFKYVYSNVKENIRFVIKKIMEIIEIAYEKNGFTAEELNELVGESLKQEKQRYKEKKVKEKTKDKESDDIEDGKLKEEKRRETEEKTKDKPKDKESNDIIYISNSGLVILHPFLPELFKHLKLTKDNKWLDKNAQCRASIVMQFLAMGNEEFLEFNLPLNKILCSIEIDDVAKQEEPFEENIKTECEKLLKETIKHWSALKNTGIDAFRQTFLQRNGKLTKVDTGWLLQVEQKGVDVLLNKLPWGIGIIKLPWMENILYVEWA